MKKRLSLIVKGAVLSLIITVMLSLLLAVCIYFFDISAGLESVLIFLIAALSCISGAFAIARAIGSKGLLTGGALGICYYIVLLIAAFIIKKDFSLDSHSLIMFVCALSAGMLGGVLGMPR